MKKLKPIVLTTTALSMLPVMADSDENFVMANIDPDWRAECSECHIAYPPQLLSKQSWGAVMSNLSDHFGSDASLDDETTAKITAFLLDHAGRSRKQSEPVLRITETRWFKHEHDEVREVTWQKADGASNCAACHQGAEQFNYDEDFIKLPR
ncbi:MAG: diheme cytochrome c [Gammaproteobacteria bacterium]|nr:diheme cytochrome c [Gammaproteobacteria bacterium]